MFSDDFDKYALTQEDASKADTSIIPQYRFEVSNDGMQPDGMTGRMVPMHTNGPDFSVERLLLLEDTVSLSRDRLFIFFLTLYLTTEDLSI